MADRLAARRVPAVSSDGTSTSAAATVWMIIGTFHPVLGGAQTQAKLLTRALRDHRMVVRILTRRWVPGMDAPLPRSESVDGTAVIRVGGRGGSRLGSLSFLLAGLLHLVRRARPAVYHAHDGGAAAWLAILAALATGGRSLVKLRSGRPVYEGLTTSRWRRGGFRLLLRWADVVVVTNQDVADLAVEMGTPRGRVIHVRNAVDLEEYRPPTPDERRSARRQLGLPERERVLLYVGRLERVKGVDVLIEAWHSVPARLRASARLVLVGGGVLEHMLRLRIGRMGSDPRVDLVGESADVRTWYWAADAFVLPSRSEGMSNALNEAAACGLPLVTSSAADPAGLVIEGVTGLSFRSEDAQELARVLEDVLVRSPEAIVGVAAVRRRAEEIADIRGSVGRLCEAYGHVDQP